MKLSALQVEAAIWLITSAEYPSKNSIGSKQSRWKKSMGLLVLYFTQLSDYLSWLLQILIISPIEFQPIPIILGQDSNFL